MSDTDTDKRKEERIKALEEKKELLWKQLHCVLAGDDKTACLIDELIRLQEKQD